MDKKLLFNTIFLLSFVGLFSQSTTHTLYFDDFSGSSLWTLGSIKNKWVINSDYNCAGLLTGNTPNNGGGRYLHVSNELSLPTYGGTCACYNPVSPNEIIYATLGTSINTIAYDEVVISFDWLCNGNANSYGFIQISTNGGQSFSSITNPREKYNQNSSWTSISITSQQVPELLNVQSLIIRFGFSSGSSRNTPGFAIDNLKVEGINNNSTFRSQIVSLTNELCSNTNNGQARVLALGGTPPYSYSWFSVDQSQIITGSDSVSIPLSPGNYYVVSSDNNNNRDTIHFQIQSTFSSPPISVSANDTICIGESSNISASGGVYYEWLPNVNINGSNTESNINVSPTQTTDYIVYARAPVDNLIINGDFSQGNVGFYSDYTFFNTIYGGGGVDMDDGRYAITNCPGDANSNWWHCNGLDHTGDAGDMLVVNGASTPGVSVWCQTIEVVPNTDYAFSAWLASMHLANLAILQFSINGELIGNSFNASPELCEWNQFYEIWNSQENTLATICIVNMNTAEMGNDFALDDIAFSPLCPGIDTVTVAVSIPQADAGNDTTLCGTNQITLSASGGESYIWNTNPPSNTQDISLSISDTETYTVTVTDKFGCTNTDDITINIGQMPITNIGTDTTLCFGESYVIDASNSSIDNYLWHDMSTSPTINASISGWYKITASNDCGNYHDSIYVTILPQQEVSISGNTSACYGSNIELVAQDGFESYLWSNSSTQQTIQVQNSGEYSVTATDQYNCNYEASVDVNFYDAPTISLGNDTTLCGGNSLNLDAGQSFQDYIWSTGEVESNINISTSGSYSVTVTDNTGCTGLGEIEVIFSQIPEISLGNDTSICNSDFNINLSVGEGFASYLWNNGSTNSSINVNQEGFYSVTVTNSDNCSATSSIQISVYDLIPIYLGDSIDICEIGSISLDAGENNGNFSFLWSTGESTQQIMVSEAGTYWVQYGNELCMVSDTVHIIGCPDLTMPNVFTPNGDGFNDRFIPDAQNIKDFKMVIYNRWGNKIFETNSYVDGWDGKINGNDAAEGTYYWTIEYREIFNSNKVKTENGTVSLIR
ncbi:MAG: gliding motility-associated C-terminal domain-containing protein [Bacteroidales bacterium]